MEKLGISPIQLATQIINFIIFAFVLRKLLYKPLLKLLEERKRKIQEGLEYTEKMKKEVEESENKRIEIIDKAKGEARKIIDEAKRAAKTVENEILHKASKESESYMEKAKKEIAWRAEEMKKEMQKETIEVATAIVERVLSQVLDETSQKVIINKKIHQLLKTKHEAKTSS